MKRVDPSTLFERWRGRALYDDELAAVARGDKAASFMCPLWRHPNDPKSTRHLPELDALELGLSVAWSAPPRMRPAARVVAASLSELWRIPAHQALYDAVELACGWDHGVTALQSRLFSYTDAQTRKHLAPDSIVDRAAAYFVVDDASAKQLRRVRGRYLDASHTITLFTPTYYAKPRGDAKRRVAPGHLARGDMSHLLWSRTDAVTAKRMWTVTIDADAFNAALQSRIEVLGAKGWRCD